MSARAVLGMATGAGFMVEPRGDNLHVEPTPPPELVDRLRQHKAAIMALLESEPWAGDPAERQNWCRHAAAEPTPELPPLPDDDEHARWLRGEISLGHDESIAWVDLPDVRLVVEDLADEGQRVGRISKILGLRRGEVLGILRRTGR